MAIRVGASPVVMTDYDEVALSVLRRNFHLNFKDGQQREGVLIEKLTWGLDLHHFKSRVSLPRFDIIIASDVVYYETGLQPMLATVAELLSENDSASFFLANEVNRFNVNQNKFCELLETFSLTYQRLSITNFVTDSRVIESFPPTFFFQIQKQKKRPSYQTVVVQ